MAKVLKDTEVLEIISKAAVNIDDANQYQDFLKEIGAVIANHFGGDVGGIGYEDGDYYVSFHPNDSLPLDGGVYKEYDTDVTWKDGVES